MPQTILNIRTGGTSQQVRLEALGKPMVYMGRGPRHGKEMSDPLNDIRLPGELNTVSRAAAVLQQQDGGWYITCEGATQMACNGQLTGQCRLMNSTKLQFNPDERGTATFEIDVTVVPDPVSQPAPPVVTPPQETGGFMWNEEDERTFNGKIQMANGVAKLPENLEHPINISLEKKAQYTIGRNQDDCDICLPHPQVSRRHAEIRREGTALVLRDLGSTNGTTVNGQQLAPNQPRTLANGDKVGIASFTLVYRNGYLFGGAQKGGVGLEAVHVTKTVKNKKGTKNITDDVSLSIKPGEFVAIIGGSGAGKSTLMNCLSGMTNYTDGQVLVDGVPLDVNSTTLRSIIGYVPQSDIVYDELTLDSMLMYSAKLRMPPDTSESDIQQKIEKTLEIVQLTEHRNTLIKKLSGGQRKRASMAVELLADPRLFFLDEPFSGLDPGTEKSLMQTLKTLAMSGRTVIMVTHSVQNIELTDRLICMGAGGRLCYSGDPNQALQYFQHFTKSVVGSFTDIYPLLDTQSGRISEAFRQYQGAPAAAPASGEVKKEKPIKHKGAGLRQFRVLTQRYAELVLNRRGKLILLMLMPIILGFFVCMAFGLNGGLMVKLYEFMKDAFGVEWEFLLKRGSFPFAEGGATESMLMTLACAAFWVGIFNSIQEISKERNIYHREQFTGVNPLPYLSSKMVINTILCLLQAVIMTTFVVMLSGYTVTYTGDTSGELAYTVALVSEGQVFSSVWLEMFITTFLTMLSAMCLGLVVSSAASNDMAMVICPICLLPQILFSGVVSSLQGITAFISNIISCRWAVLGYCFTVDINGDVTGHNMGTTLTYLGSDKGVSPFKLIGYGVYGTRDQSSMDMAGKLDYGDLTDKIFHRAAQGVTTYNPENTHIFGLDAVPAAWVCLSMLVVACFMIAWGILLRNSSRTAALQSVNGKGRGKRNR